MVLLCLAGVLSASADEFDDLRGKWCDLLTGGTNAARSGALNPILAMYTPLALFTIIGLFAVQSANREMGSARSAGVFASIRNIFRRSE